MGLKHKLALYVAPKYPDQSAIIEVDRFSSADRHDSGFSYHVSRQLATDPHGHKKRHVGHSAPRVRSFRCPSAGDSGIGTQRRQCPGGVPSTLSGTWGASNYFSLSDFLTISLPQQQRGA